MKIISQSVKLLSPQNKEAAIAEVKKCEYAGRNCYRTQGRITETSHEQFLKSLIKRGHHSPLEFANFMFEITTSRDVMAEITRHRMASFAIQSQRYVLDNKEGEISFIRPNFYVEPYLRGDDFLSIMSRNWENGVSACEASYLSMIACGATAQDARKVLPNSTATHIEMCCNLRELLHIFELRCSEAAYPEMRTMATLMRDEVRNVLPFLFEEETEDA